MTKATFAQFLQYLQDELAISKASIEAAAQRLGQDSYLLPIALWQSGCLTLKQLDQTCDWLAIAHQKQASEPEKMRRDSYKLTSPEHRRIIPL